MTDDQPTTPVTTDEPTTPVTTDDQPTTPVTTDDQPTAMKLGDEFDAALIGATIQGQYAYSLTRLSMIVMQDLHVHPETAQKMVAEQVVTIIRKHGADAPVFVDDSLMFGADIAVEPESEIVTEETPPQVTSQPIFTGEPTEKPDNVILIPGVTHGACKGFLDPNGLHS